MLFGPTVWNEFDAPGLTNKLRLLTFLKCVFFLFIF